MKIGVFTVLFNQRPFEEALDYVKAAGCEAVEVGVGGYPGAAHADAAALLEDDAARKRFQDAVTSRGLEISALSCHGNPLHPRREIAEADDRDLPQRGAAGSETRGADGDHLLRVPRRWAGGHGAELGDLPLAAELHRVARVAVERAGQTLLVGSGDATPRTTACGSRSSCTRGSSPTTPIRSTGCARSAARRSGSTSIPRTSSGRGWTRWSVSAPSGTPSSTSMPRTPGWTAEYRHQWRSRHQAVHRRDPPLVDLPHGWLRPWPAVLALTDQ